MIPTLQVGDHIFVHRRRQAQLGDVIVFPFPEHPNQDFVERANDSAYPAIGSSFERVIRS